MFAGGHVLIWPFITKTTWSIYNTAIFPQTTNEHSDGAWEMLRRMALDLALMLQERTESDHATGFFEDPEMEDACM